MTSVNLLGISGSLRAGSFSTAILRSLQDEVPSGVALRLHPLDNLPLYNQDLDADEPPAGVSDLRDAISLSDGLVIVTPEFNYGLPGVLKNALDWASRPHGKGALIGKPVVTMSASPAFTGGIRAQAQLHETLLATQSILIPRAQVVIAEVHNKLADGRLVDEASLGFARDAVRDLARAIRARESEQQLQPA
ncbi:chromate reductase [Novosphingobium sp. CF614]|uniref:NADPH-dependent FMN reductase n=1 Tax=Novosphingobium sp. CF614 TaxID=1884364 RepID=UPI0008E92CDB|nr:NAD(P)H-dependent oxidoreductase [Novosphingobium sp. CF614]SFG49722.1 chromate reductase [Novosphingobium sp. CF614]